MILSLYSQLPPHLQAAARDRLAAVDEMDRLCAQGRTHTAAAALASAKFKVSTASLWVWRASAYRTFQSDRLSALASRHHPSIRALIFKCFRCLPERSRRLIFIELARVYAPELRAALKEAGQDAAPAGDDAGGGGRASRPAPDHDLRNDRG